MRLFRIFTRGRPRHARVHDPGLNVAVLAAVEAQALGGLVVLLRAASLDVVAAREGPRVVVGLDDGGA